MVSKKENAARRIPRGNTSNLRRILVAVDGSEDSKRATIMAATIAEKYESELIVLNVIPGRAYDRLKAAAERKAREIVDREMATARDYGIKARWEVLPSTESIVGQIVDYADREKVDMIVIGTRGLGGFKRMLIGSVSSGVVTHASCPVLVVR
jgi:nucleotide-binding universal stress UspA family protein